MAGFFLPFSKLALYWFHGVSSIIGVKMKNFPTLYKKTSTGAIQFWTIATWFGRESETGDDAQDYTASIITTYGQLGTDSPQVTHDKIKEGKNKGKKNETSAEQQADAEAQAKWEKQKKKGYVETKEEAEAGTVDAIIEGGIVPMLAHKFRDQGHKIKYPAFAQPKLDGHRCIAIVKDSQVSLWSRTRKRITSMPHIEAEIAEIFKASADGTTYNAILDGELYNHDFKKDFEKITSAIRKEKPEEGYLNVQYHIYDMDRNGDFEDRTRTLRGIMTIHEDRNGPFKYLKRVTTQWVENEEQLMEFFEASLVQGYEGAMVRNAAGEYENKRSYNLLKIKEFDDAEFPIIGIEEGRGKLAGHAIFICRDGKGKEFSAKMRGDTSKLKEFFDNRSLWDGKMLTVQYQGLTGKEGVPRFPVGVRIREDA
jgi:ATP-dependent DNA ligase